MSEHREEPDPQRRGRPLYASSKLRTSADRELIECVRSRPVLYDPTHSRYMDNPLKMSIWTKIGRQLRASPNACKARWNNIRDNYRKSLRRRSWQGTAQYKYSALLAFMDRFYKTKPNPGLTKPSELETKEHERIEVGSQKSEDQDETSNEAEDAKESDTQASSTMDVSSIKVDRSDEADQPESMVDYEYFEKSSTSVSGSYPSQEQAVDAFLGALAPPLKSLSPYHLSLAKAEIFATVHKYELKALMGAGWGDADANPLP